MDACKARRWAGWTLLALLAAAAALYLGDYALYRLRGSPRSSVAVQRFLAVPLKGGRTEFDLLDGSESPCTRTLFGQEGLSPCWRLRRQPIEEIHL